ncbi:DNA polymerase-1 [Arthrobacter roseus]|nr:DNA polymerase-1 [Arthrobacter roseus]
MSQSTKTDANDTSRLLVIDGHSMAFRAFYALPPENFATDTGQHTNAVYGFVSMLIKMIEQRKPTHVAVAFDLDTPTFRSEEYSEYKAGRNKTPEEFYGQINLIEKVMEAMNIPSITMDGFEADDIIATLARVGEDEGWDVLVVSGDRDAFQLITEKTTVLYPKKGISDIPPMDAAAVEAKYFVQPAQYPDLAALVGETADNLPGVPGVGPKTAAKWINLYGGLEGILDQAESIKGKVGESLRAHLDDVRRNRRLNRLLTDLDLPVELGALELEHPNQDAIEELFDALQFNTLRKRLFDLFGADDSEPEAEMDVPTPSDLDSAETLTGWFREQGAHVIGVLLDTVPSTVNGDDAVGIALAGESATGYIDLEKLDADADAALSGILSSGDYKFALHDFKAGYKLLADRGIDLRGVVDDTMISAYLIQPDRRSHELTDIAQHHLRLSLEAEGKAQDGQLALEFDGSGHSVAAVRAAYIVRELSLYLTGQVLERGANMLLAEMELPLSVVLAQMERTGIAVDAVQLDDLLADFTTTIDGATAEAYEAIGHEVNLGSPKQLQVVLFEELGLPKTKKIKTGYTTDADSLADLLAKTQHPFLASLMAYRDATKLRQTVEGLKKSLGDDGRIHTTYAQTVAATGRLSSLNPNLQNIPVRSEAGRRIREVFVVGEGYETLLTADYSQIEMRIMAHLSGDEGLIQAFKDGEDLHRFVGSHVFGVEPADVSPDMRSKVKAMSYGLAYGLSSFGLSNQLNVPVDEARGLIRDYFARFGSVRDYLRTVVDQARKDGYTSTIEGRRRYLPDLASDNRQLRDMAERAALNAPIQGTAADIIKRAMLGVADGLREQRLESRMLLQVHDELVLEVAPGEIDVVSALVREHMGTAAELSVPLDVQIGTGHSWQEAAH